MLAEEKVKIVIQINGKKREIIETSKDNNESAILDMIKNNDIIKKYLENKKIIKKIFVPNKIINLIIK